jgi:glycosyltransferase involved in cell wall biosynthesis
LDLAPWTLCLGSMMKISIVVPAFNEEAGLGAALCSIRSAMRVFDRRGWSSELIVCDNNSTDRTAAIARDAGATVVFEQVNQIGRARNTGAAYATGDWLIFVDADSHPSPALFDDVAAEIERGRCLAGGSTIVYDNPHPFARVMVRTWNRVSRLNRWAAGSFIFCDRGAFREVGGFNLQFFAGEEIDLFRRLKRLARRYRRTIKILRDHPLLTSDRKMRLYTVREIATFLLRTMMTPRRTLSNPRQCHAWYDGRR